MLAVIQHQQHLLPGQHPRQRLGHRHSGLLPDPQRRRHHARNLPRILHRRQLGQPHPVREPARHPPRHLTSQPRLPRTTRPGHRHQPAPLQHPRDLTHRTSPADKTRQRNRETMHASRHGCHPRPPHARTISADPHRRTAQPPTPPITGGSAHRPSMRPANSKPHGIGDQDGRALVYQSHYVTIAGRCHRARSADLAAIRGRRDGSASRAEL
jgi:hypothetical protein